MRSNFLSRSKNSDLLSLRTLTPRKFDLYGGKKVGPVQKGTIISQEIHMQEMKMEHPGIES